MLTKMLVAIGSIVLLPAVAQAPVQSIAPKDIDLNLLNCGEFIKSDPETSKRIMFWLGGYYTYEDDSAVIGVAKLEGKERQIKQYCADNQDLPMSSASEIFMDKKFSQ